MTTHVLDHDFNLFEVKDSECLNPEYVSIFSNGNFTIPEVHALYVEAVEAKLMPTIQDFIQNIELIKNNNHSYVVYSFEHRLSGDFTNQMSAEIFLAVVQETAHSEYVRIMLELMEVKNEND